MNYEQRLYTFLTANKKLKLMVTDIARIWKRSAKDVNKAANTLVKRGILEFTDKGYLRVQ